nr:beta-lactamase [uncultured bacterium]
MDLDQLGTSLETLAKACRVPGAQLAVLRRGDIRLFEFGEEEYASGRAMTRYSQVPVGSITKLVTATLTMALVSDGDIDLDEPLGHYLPDLRRLSPDLAGVLTPRHLLSHTGGLASEATHTVRAGRHLGALHTVRPPGSDFSYSNLGYCLLGQVVETITGMSWHEAAAAILLKPLQIEPCFVGLPGAAPTVSGHSVHHRCRPVDQALEPVEAPAGALAASAADLVTLGRMHLPHEHGGSAEHLVSPDDLAQMRTPVDGADPFGLADGWGLGFAMFGDGWIGHDGMADGTACYLRISRRRARSSRSRRTPTRGQSYGASSSPNCGRRGSLSVTATSAVCPGAGYRRLATASERTSTASSSTR